MNLWRSLTGALEVELTSAQPEQSLAAIAACGIELLSIRRVDELSCRFWIPRQAYLPLSSLAQKRGERLCLLGRKGLYWVGKSAMHHPILLAGLTLLIAMTWFLPTKVLFVQVTGNETVPTRRILEAAEEWGVCFGASRRSVRSEKVKNALLSQIPQLQWAGINTSGCVATISVRERAEVEEEPTEGGVSSIVAARDGFILSGTAIRGNPLFQIGQTVEKGQVLISGYTDCGICIQATRAEGEVFAQTQRSANTLTPAIYTGIAEEGPFKRKYSLLLRKKRINLWKDSGISTTTCGRMYKEYYVTLPGGFSLPIALCVETFVPYRVEPVQLPETQAEEALGTFSRSYLLNQMVAGSIREQEHSVSLQNGAYHMAGRYVCVEMIGREQKEQIGVANE